MVKLRMWICDWLGYVFCEAAFQWDERIDYDPDFVAEEGWRWQVFSCLYSIGSWFYNHGDDAHADQCQCTDCGGIGYENMTDEEYFSRLEEDCG